MKNFLKYQLPFLLWVICIFAISSIPRVPVIKSPISLDKLAHMALFLVLSWLGWRAFWHQAKIGWLHRGAVLAAILFSVLYGVLDEIHQLYVPGRNSDVFDVLADVTGALIFALWHVWRKSRLIAENDPQLPGTG